MPRRENCEHQSVLVIPFDFGFCSETGYHDAGERTVCADCGEVPEVA
jgi:hypothetical protein